MFDETKRKKHMEDLYIILWKNGNVYPQKSVGEKSGIG
jgi:hypothetical protein